MSLKQTLASLLDTIISPKSAALSCTVSTSHYHFTISFTLSFQHSQLRSATPSRLHTIIPANSPALCCTMSTSHYLLGVKEFGELALQRRRVLLVARLFFVGLLRGRAHGRVAAARDCLTLNPLLKPKGNSFGCSCFTKCKTLCACSNMWSRNCCNTWRDVVLTIDVSRYFDPEGRAAFFFFFFRGSGKNLIVHLKQGINRTGGLRETNRRARHAEAHSRARHARRRDCI